MPELSAVCLAGARRERASRLLTALGDQTARDRVELVLVDTAPAAGALDTPAGLKAVRIEMPPQAGLGATRAAGARAAGADIVAFVFDHCRPDPGWAEALIERYRSGPWASVGYAFRLQPPETPARRAALLAQFGAWAGLSGPVTSLPGISVSYRREELARFDGELDELLEIDLNLHRRLLADGARIAHEPRASVAYEAFATLRGGVAANHDYARVLAATRARLSGWGAARRLAAALALPLVAARRIAVVVAGLRRDRDFAGGRRALPGAAIVCLASALGESRGCLLGGEDASRRVRDWELDAGRDGR